MLECWNEDHIKRPTFAIIETKIEELLMIRCVHAGVCMHFVDFSLLRVHV